MLQRLKTAIPLIAVVLAAFFVPGLTGKCFFLAFALLLLIGAVREACALGGLPKFGAYEIAADIFGALMLIGAAAGAWLPSWPLPGMAWDVLVMALVLLVGFCVLFRRGLNMENMRELGVWTLIALTYAWCLMFLPKLYFLPGGHGPLILCFLVTVTKLADIGAYFAGSATAHRVQGNHKLAPNVSPKKSWEGLAGGIIFSLAGAAAFKHFAGTRLSFAVLDHTTVVGWMDAVLLGVVAPVAGLLGDLAESAFKRVAGAKDSGHLPGLGGVLDFLDSLVPMGPLFFAWLLLRSLCG